MRACVVEHLIAPGRSPAGYLLGQRTDDTVHGVLVQVRNHTAVLVGPEVLESDLVSVLVEPVAAVDDGPVRLLLSPRGVSVVMVDRLMQHGCGAGGQIESGVGQLGQH